MPPKAPTVELDQPREIPRHCQVAADCECPQPVGLALEQVAAPGEHRHVRALGRERLGDRKPHSGRGAADDCGPSLQPKIHQLSLVTTGTGLSLSQYWPEPVAETEAAAPLRFCARAGRVPDVRRSRGIGAARAGRKVFVPASLLTLPVAAALFGLLGLGGAGAVVRADRGATASAAARLVLGPTDAPGLRPRPARPAAAVRVLDAALSPAGVPRTTTVRAQASHFGKGKTDLWSLAFAMRNASAARAQVTAIVRAARGLVPRRVPLGQGGYLLGSSAAGRRPVVALWRRGATVGGIVFVGPLRPRDISGVALSYAKVADSRMARAASATAWTRALERIGPKGQVSKSTALTLFTLAYGPLPGTKRPAGPSEEIPDGTLAAKHVLSIWQSLTPAQRAAAGQLLGVHAVSRSRRTSGFGPGGGPAGSERPATFGDASFVPNATLQTVAENFQKFYEAKLNVKLKFQIVAGGTTAPVKDAAADALPVDEQGDISSNSHFCRIRQTIAGQHAPIPVRNLTMAHEVFHCFEFDVTGPTGWFHTGDWIMEGMADWAALRAYPVSWAQGGGSFQAYLDTCQTVPLFARAYSAVGFFGQYEDSIGELWPQVAAIVSKPGDVAAYHAAGGNVPDFLNSWASRSLVASTLGLAWYPFSPIPAPSGSGCPALPVSGDTTVLAGEYTLWPYAIEAAPAERPLLHVENLQGRARLADGTVDTTALSDEWFCVDGECTCPAGTEGSPPPAPKLQLPAFLALTGGETGARTRLTFVSLEQFCKKKQPPPSPSSAGGSGGASGGGPVGAGGGGGERAPRPTLSSARATAAATRPPIRTFFPSAATGTTSRQSASSRSYARQWTTSRCRSGSSPGRGRRTCR